MLGQTVKLMGRNMFQNSVRFGSHGGVPGEHYMDIISTSVSSIASSAASEDNLPFQIQNRYRLTALFIAFFGSGIAAPFLIVRHQLLKSKG